MKKILVLFTGGTIGSFSKDGIINVAGDGRFDLISQYREHFGNDIKFECRQIMNILSENIHFSHWQRLTQILMNVDTSNYLGIIIPHGSDTLAYTSAFLAMFFRHIDIGVYIIASNKPLNQKGSNGLFNFAAAVDKILEGKYKGVFTLYEKVYLPTRIIPADPYWDKFSCYGDDGSENHLFNGVSEKMLNKPLEKLFHENICFDNKIMMITGYPGLDYSQFSLANEPYAVLFVPYHSATACVDASFGNNYSLCKFIEKCIVKDIMVYICQIKQNSEIYSSLKSILSAGSIPMYNTSYPSAYMKLLIAANQKEYPVKKIINRNLYYEILSSPIR